MAPLSDDASGIPPLCVDLDGTLIAGDTLLISVMCLVRQQPLSLVPLAFRLVRGRAAFKEAVARRVVPDPSTLPWRREVVDFVLAQKASGRAVWLTTAAHRRVADRVAAHLGCFDGVIATEDAAKNRKGDAKLEAIRRALGHDAFDYIGDTAADLPILKAARKGYLVAPNTLLRARAERVGRIERIFE